MRTATTQAVSTTSASLLMAGTALSSGRETFQKQVYLLLYQSEEIDYDKADPNRRVNWNTTQAPLSHDNSRIGPSSGVSVEGTLFRLLRQLPRFGGACSNPISKKEGPSLKHWGGGLPH